MPELQTGSYHANNFVRAFRRWFVPYVQSRVMPSEFRPLLSYLFTEWKCNVDCHYCWAFNNKVKGMTEETAIRSIDWLKDVGCRVIAIMGGEPLLRRDFILKVVDYGTNNGFFVYLPTNGILMNEDFIDKVGDRGVAAINLAVDSMDEKPGLAKNFKRIEKQFKYLVQQQRKYGYMIVFNTNICRHNLDDVKQLTEIAHDNGISTDVHINEPPYIEQPHFQHLNENVTYIRPEDWPAVDEVLDWLIEKCAGLHHCQLQGPPAQDEGFHARHHLPVELPRRAQLLRHPHRRHPGAVLPHVLGQDGLGQDRRAEVQLQRTGRDEEGV